MQRLTLILSLLSSNDWSEGEYDQECEAVEHYQDIVNEFIIRLESELELPHSQSGRDCRIFVLFLFAFYKTLS